MMEDTEMPKFDITKLNVAIDQLLETTQNPRHRFMLQAYARHRALELAGRFEEIFAPEMMSMNPVYHFSQAGNELVLRGQDEVKSLYRMWAETNQSIFFIETEEVAVADHFICSVATSYQQVSGTALRQAKILKHLPHKFAHALVEKALTARGFKANDNDVYLYRTPGMQMVWPYDDRCRLIGEDVWEPEPSKAEIHRLEPGEVLSTEQAAKLLAPIIKPLPAFDEATMGVRR